MSTLDVMGPDHPKWEEFSEAMLGLSAECEHNRNRSRTATVLRDLDCDVVASLEALAALGGGCCDCEVILNVVLRDET